MYDSSSAFTHDDFQSSIEDDHVSTAAFNTVTLPEAVVISNNILASEHVTQHDTANNLVTAVCGESSIEADLQDLNPHGEILVDTVSYGESGNVNVAPEEVPVHRIDPKISDRLKTAESDTVTFQGDMIEIRDLGHGINQDPMCAPTLHEFPVKAAASCEEAVPRAILMTCKAAQDTGNKPVKAAFEGENLVPDAICPSTPRRKTCRPLRPSRDIHPIYKSPSSMPAKRRHAVSIRPSRVVQPIMSQTFARAVVVKATSDPQTVLTKATDSTVSESSSAESDPVPQLESRKREAARKMVETAKRARQSDECMSLILIMPSH